MTLFANTHYDCVSFNGWSINDVNATGREDEGNNFVKTVYISPNTEQLPIEKGCQKFMDDPLSLCFALTGTAGTASELIPELPRLCLQRCPARRSRWRRRWWRWRSPSGWWSSQDVRPHLRQWSSPIRSRRSRWRSRGNPCRNLTQIQ